MVSVALLVDRVVGVGVGVDVDLIVVVVTTIVGVMMMTVVAVRGDDAGHLVAWVWWAASDVERTCSFSSSFDGCGCWA